MSVPASASIEDALVACTVFDTFDHAVLRGVLQLDEPTIAEVLGRAEVELAAPAKQIYRLRSIEFPALLDKLRQSQAQDEYAMHRRAFTFYLERLQDQPQRGLRPIYQAACMHHLRHLRDLSQNYMRWDDVTTMIGAMRSTGRKLLPNQAAQLALYDAHALIRQQHYRRAEGRLSTLLRRRQLSPQLRAQTLLMLGVAQMNQAHYEHALAFFQQALAIAMECGDNVAAGRALINQSWIHNELFQFSAAFDLSTQSLAYYRQGHDLYGAAYALYAIGNNALYLGQWDVGRQHLDQAAEIYTAAGMRGGLAMVEWGLGHLHQILGDEELSKQAYMRALEIARSPMFSNKVIEMDTLASLGLLYQTQHDHSQAATFFTQALALARELSNDHLCGMLLHRSALIALNTNGTATAVRLLRQAVEYIERTRVSMKSQEMKIGLLGTAQQVYESIVLALVAQGDFRTAFGYVERARARAFLDLLAQRDENLGFLHRFHPVSLDAIQARLGPKSLVLEYYTIGTIAPGESFLNRIPQQNGRLRSQLTSRPEILLFAITATEVSFHRIDFDPNWLYPIVRDVPGGFSLTSRKLAWLYTTLLAPVEHLLAGKSVLHIVPHGPLHAVPFVALLKPDGSAVLDSESPAVTYAPSATLLCDCLDQQASAGTQAMALGYNGHGALELRFAEREAELVSTITAGYAYTGSVAKSADLLRLGPQLHHLHIACHAVFSPDDPLSSYLQIGADDALDARTLMQKLRLSASVVTLNACTTGLSHVASGDELLGLPRAFLYAGATTILCSLYQVDDLAAYVFMILFFEQFSSGSSPSLALHAAQMALRVLHRNEITDILRRSASDSPHIEPDVLDGYDAIPFAHPRYWAPFMVIGKP